MKEECAGHCGRRKPAKFNYCAWCRAGLPKPESVCAGCGAPSDGNLFCEKCGAALIAAGERLADQESYNASVRELIEKDKLTIEQAQGRLGQVPAPYSDIHREPQP